MPKYVLQWKDPDFCDAKTGEYLDELYGEEYDKLRQLGAREYIAVEFDTDSMTTRVVERKR